MSLRKEGELDLESIKSNLVPPPGRHRERRGFLRRFFSPWTIGKILGYGALDLQPEVIPTGWSLADVAVAAGGTFDIVAGTFQRERNTDDRARLVVRGFLKIGVAAIPFVPAAPLSPILDAASEVDRNIK